VISACGDNTVQTYMERYVLTTLRNRITYRRLNHEEFNLRIR
jgi:hypothetical protein